MHVSKILSIPVAPTASSSRLLDRLLISMLALCALAMASFHLHPALVALRSDGFDITCISMFVLLSACAIVNRLGFVQVAASATGIGLAAAILYFATRAQAPEAEYILNFLVIPAVMTSPFFSLRTTIAAAVLTILAMFVIPALDPELTLSRIFYGPFFLVSVVHAFVILMTRHRDNVEKQRLTALAEGSERFRLVLDMAHDGIVLIEDDRIVETNHTFREMFAFDRLDHAHLQDALGATNATTIKRALDLNDKGTFTSTLVDHHKNSFNAEIAYSRFDLAGKSMCVVSIRDITERHRLEGQLRHAQKMQAIGTLVSGVAHDFNNILSAIIGFADMASRRLHKSEFVEMSLHQVLTSAHRARDLVARLLSFGRPREHERRAVWLSEVTTEVAELLRASMPPGIHLDLDIAPDCAPILADSSQIHQVVLNLGTNAYQSMKHSGGRLSISVTNLSLDGESAAAFVNISPGSYVQLCVSDTGPGIPAEIQDQIFDPYFTTKAKGEGTGLGLATVGTIVASLDGAITFDSTPQKGTTFRLLFPAHTHHFDHIPVDDRPSVSLVGQEHILFVDDEPLIAELAETSLPQLGYRVSAHTSAREALNVYSRASGAFDVVITDIAMPDMSGIELIRKIREIDSSQTIIVCSGLVDNDIRKDIEALKVATTVFKPISARDLAAAVRTVRDSK
jgi:signal transduction histidine kinase/ActR/RegA family two-component response regulator